jgi:hypothetical protein
MITEPFRNEHFYRLTQELGPRVPENPLGMSIDHDDLAGPIDHHHSIGRSLDDHSEALFGGNLLLRLVPVEEILAVRHLT